MDSRHLATSSIKARPGTSLNYNLGAFPSDMQQFMSQSYVLGSQRHVPGNKSGKSDKVAHSVSESLPDLQTQVQRLKVSGFVLPLCCKLDPTKLPALALLWRPSFRASEQHATCAGA